MKSKTQKVREYFQKHPLATPKEVGARFKCAMPVVYKIRKEEQAKFIERSNAPDHNPIIEVGYVKAHEFKPSEKARDMQFGGDHYKNMGVEPWDVVDTWPIEQRIGYYRGGALKYIMRMGNKDQSPMEIAKGKHYMQKLLEVLEDEANA
jgi:hypothetical protein